MVKENNKATNNGYKCWNCIWNYFLILHPTYIQNQLNSLISVYTMQSILDSIAEKNKIPWWTDITILFPLSLKKHCYTLILIHVATVWRRWEECLNGQYACFQALFKSIWHDGTTEWDTTSGMEALMSNFITDGHYIYSMSPSQL